MSTQKGVGQWELLSRWGCQCRAGSGPSHPSAAFPIAGTISHPSHQPVTTFFSFWSPIQVLQANLRRADNAAPRLSPTTAHAVLPRDGWKLLPGEPLLCAILRALHTALPELPPGFSLPSLVSVHRPPTQDLSAFQCFGLLGFFLASGMASLGPRLLQPPAPPAFAAGTGDL